MTEAERLMALKMIGDLEAEVVQLVQSTGQGRAWSIAVTKVEECAMWLRKAVNESEMENT
jgi:hypothetical protein